MIGECVKSEVYRRSDGRQELRACIRSGISQAANGVHSAVVLYGLAFVSSERAELHCSEPLQSTYLFRRQTDQDRVAVIKAGGNQRLVLQKFFRKDEVGWMRGVVIQEQRNDRHCLFGSA